MIDMFVSFITTSAEQCVYVQGTSPIIMTKLCPCPVGLTKIMLTQLSTSPILCYLHTVYEWGILSRTNMCKYTWHENKTTDFLV